jgi:type I restriction enzyme, S subunit
MSEWRTLRLEDCMSAIIDYRGRSPNKTSTGVPLITAKVIKSGRIAPPDEFIDELDYEEWMSRGIPQTGDVVMTTEAPLGEVAQLDGRRVALAQRIITLRGKQGVLDQNFLKFLLQSQAVQEELRSRATGTTVLGIRQSELRKLELTLPPYSMQQRIGHILGTLDDKIELNRRMNETLEAMARAIFQSWFVDFDPVRAKASGEPTESICQRLGLTPELLALFPNAMRTTVAGEGPSGWEVGPLQAALVLQRGFDLPASDRTPGLFPVLAASGPNGTHKDFIVRGPGVTTGRSGVLGKVYFVHGDFWPLNTSLWVKEFRRATPAFAFYLLRGLDFAQYNSGSAVPTLNRNHVHGMPVFLPPLALVNAFDEIAMTNLRQQRALEDESCVLTDLRNTLLPRLLSGEQRVFGENHSKESMHV